MRIRKRAVPFPLSSLLPVPITDPLFNLNRPPPVPVVVQLQPGGPSDRPIGQGSSINGSELISDKGEKKKSQDYCSELLSQKIEGEKPTDIRNNGAQEGSLLKPSPSSTSPQQVVPPKKRSRGSFEETGEKEKKKKKKKNKKRSNLGGRGGALMEGSRCSRVNGRGWRCCQQTLVGYSLCEHHLGKGRLRTMTSVRTRSLSSSTQSAAPAPPIVSHQTIPPPDDDGDGSANIDDDDDDDDDYDYDYYADEMTKGSNNSNIKKRTKLGMVKARSISSLLGQTTTSNTTTVATPMTTADRHDNQYI